jgi:hypothetical protein
MYIPLKQFVASRNKYCFAYFGQSNDYILLLKTLRPFMESAFKGTQIYIACSDESYYLLQDEPRVVKKSSFNKGDYCYVDNFNCDFNSHPVERIMSESKLEIPVIRRSPKDHGNTVYLYTKGILPTKSLSDKQTESIVRIYKSNGKVCLVDQKHDGKSQICSVESEIFVTCALAGIDCTLVETGTGKNLLKRMFPDMRTIKP